MVDFWYQSHARITVIEWLYDWTRGFKTSYILSVHRSSVWIDGFSQKINADFSAFVEKIVLKREDISET